jgi:hypothetical protein
VDSASCSVLVPILILSPLLTKQIYMIYIHGCLAFFCSVKSCSCRRIFRVPTLDMLVTWSHRKSHSHRCVAWKSTGDPSQMPLPTIVGPPYLCVPGAAQVRIDLCKTRSLKKINIRLHLIWKSHVIRNWTRTYFPDVPKFWGGQCEFEVHPLCQKVLSLMVPQAYFTQNPQLSTP